VDVRALTSLYTAWERYVEAERLERESIAATVRTWASILEPDQKY